MYGQPSLCRSLRYFQRVCRRELREQTECQASEQGSVSLCEQKTEVHEQSRWKSAARFILILHAFCLWLVHGTQRPDRHCPQCALHVHCLCTLSSEGISGKGRERGKRKGIHS